MALHPSDDPLAARIRACLLDLLAEPANGDGICPSEAAHRLAVHLGLHWQELMRPVRTVAIALAAEGLIEGFQQDVTVDLGEARGPVRLRLASLPGHRTPCTA